MYYVQQLRTVNQCCAITYEQLAVWFRFSVLQYAESWP